MAKHRVWLLFRGLVREKRHWENFPNALQAYFPDDKIVLYNFPGNGQRYNENSKTRIVGMVTVSQDHFFMILSNLFNCRHPT